MVPLDTGPGLVAFGIEDAAAGSALLGCVEWGFKWNRVLLRACELVGTLLVQGPKHSCSHSRGEQSRQADSC